MFNANALESSVHLTRKRQRSNRRRPKSYLRNLTLKGNLNEILPNTDANSGRVASTGPAAFETYHSMSSIAPFLTEAGAR